MYSYELKCSDIEEDLHDIVTRRINTVLAKLFNKYCKPYSDRRVITTAYIEEDGARVEAIYTGHDLTLEESIINSLFQLRDLLVTNKLSFDAFRQKVGRLAFTTYTSSPHLYQDLEELLSVMNCSLTIKYRIPRRLSLAFLAKYVSRSTPSFTLSFDPKDAVNLKLVLRDKGKPLSKKIRIQYESSEGSANVPIEFSLKTDRNGEIMLPARKFSKIKITVPYPIRRVKAVEIPRGEEVKVVKTRNNQLDVVIGNSNIELYIDVNRGRYLLYLLIGAAALHAILVTLLILLLLNV